MDAVHLVVLVGVAYLLSWVIHAYLLRRFADDEREDDALPTAPRRASRSPQTPVEQSGATATSDTVACPACGAENERGYTFCRGCVADLSVAGRHSPEGRPR